MNKTSFDQGCQNAAARYLMRRGYNVLDRNWSCPAGECDIVAFDEDEDCLVFVEVKGRKGFDQGFPAEATTEEKRDRLEKIALFYLAEHPIADVRVRFDVASIVLVADDRALMRHHINCMAVI